MNRVAALGKIGILREVRENAVRPYVYVLPAVLLKQDLSIGGHENGDRC